MRRDEGRRKGVKGCVKVSDFISEEVKKGCVAERRGWRGR